MTHHNDNTIFFTEQMEEFAKRKRLSLPPEQRALVDALAYIEILRHQGRDDRGLCAHMRASALQYSAHEPLLSVHMDIIADSIDPKH